MEKFDENEQLRHDARKGLEMRLCAARPVASREEYVKRLEYELNFITDTGFADCFLIAADFINWAKRNGILVCPGFDSDAGSLIAWSLRITDVDPLRFGLLFERFINPERVNSPDFSFVFCKGGRERVLAYVREKYDPDRITQIHNPNDKYGMITLGNKRYSHTFFEAGILLTLLRDTLDLIGKDYDFLSAIPIGDAATYEMLANGDAGGLFHNDEYFWGYECDSGGMIRFLQKIKPDCIDNLIAAISLYRSEPMGDVPCCIPRKQGKKKFDYSHPALEPILKDTFGIFIYQEQFMRIAREMAGYTLGGADLLRRVMRLRIINHVAKQKPIFMEGAAAKGVPLKTAYKLFTRMEKFAEYGVCKANAAAYALCVYQAAYLKCHYRSEFMRALADLGVKMMIPVLKRCLRSGKIENQYDFELNENYDKTGADKGE